MPNPINNKPLAAKAGLEGNLGGNGTPRVTPRVSERQGNTIFQGVNQRLTPAKRGTVGNQPTAKRTATTQNNNTQGNGTRTRTRTGNPQANANGQQTRGVRTRQTQTNGNTRTQGNPRGNQGNGAANASAQGLLHGNGLNKNRGTNTNQNPNANTTNTTTQTNQNTSQGNTTAQNQTGQTNTQNNSTNAVNIPPIETVRNNTTTQNVQNAQTNQNIRNQTLRTNNDDGQQQQTTNQTNGKARENRLERTNTNNIPLEPEDNHGHGKNNRNDNFGTWTRQNNGRGNPHRGGGENNGWHNGQIRGNNGYQGNSQHQNQVGEQNNLPVIPTRNPHPKNSQTEIPHDLLNQSLNQNSLGQNNRQNNYQRQVFREVLRQNNIHLNGNVINDLFRNTKNQTAAQNQVLIPREVRNLVADIRNQVLTLTNNTVHPNGRDVRQVANEILVRLSNEIETAKPIFFQDKDFGAKLFRNLNMIERMHVAVEILPSHLPADVADILQNFSLKEIQGGLLLPFGFIAGRENSADLRALIAFQPPILPREITVTNLRDVGQFVRVLVAETAVAKMPANLDLAVQKFVRLLLANNELGVLLATINLASQTVDRGGLTSRTIELVKIYELIMRFISSGEKMLKEATAEPAAKLSATAKEELSIKSVGAKTIDAEEKSLSIPKHSTGAESSLRQFLEFNPNAAFDNSASAFTNSEDARQAQKDFAAHNHDEIESWLQSGKHRFVKDFDFEKPLGVVVERNSDGFFSASRMRVVLVRDGSVQGWHFLKSVLVR